MSIFEIQDIRKIIFSFIYPTKVVKGMLIEIVENSFNPFFYRKIVPIHEIVKHKNNDYTIILCQEPDRRDSMWYRVYSYLYPNKGDVIKVVNANIIN